MFQGRKHLQYLKARFLRYKSFLLVGATIATIIVVTRMPNSSQSAKQLTTPSPSLRLGEPAATPMPMIVRGSIPYWDQKNAVLSFTKNISAFDQIALFWYFVTAEGEIQKYRYTVEDSSIIDTAHRENIKVSVLIANLPEQGTWDSKRVEKVIGDNEKRAKHIGDIERLLSRLDADGVTIDYEEVASPQRENFSLFIDELSQKLHEHGKFVGVALHPKLGSRRDERYAFQDWQALAKSADYLYIMAYGEHYDEGEAGPIASLPWVSKIVDMVEEENIPKHKVILGIPLYGYDWNKDTDEAAAGLTYQDVQRLIRRFEPNLLYDEEVRSPHFIYETRGQTHEVWYEDVRSVEAKVVLAKRSGLGGITFWRLGGEDPEIWEILPQ